MTTKKQRHYKVIMIMGAILVVAVTFAIGSIESTMPMVYREDANASPGGYTWSLSIFLVPLLCLGTWVFRRRKELHYQWEALILSLCIIIPVWSALDIFAGLSFFVFPNSGATILPEFVPGWIPGEGFTGLIPTEEFIFYIGGGMATLTLYIWSCHQWFNHYSLTKDEYNKQLQTISPAVVFHYQSLLYGVIALIIAYAYKKLIADYSDGGPYYFMFLLVLAVLPGAALFVKIGELINERALIFTMLVTMLISLMWEVTLALPYGWWGYNYDSMIGFFISPWFNLPIEASILWLVAAWSNVFIFELFRAYKATGKPFLELLFGSKKTTTDNASTE